MNEQPASQVFIATRFNVVYAEAHFSRDKAGNPTRTEAWLTRRFELFEQICLPSLVAQTDPAFQWLIFLSDGTPEAFKERMRGHSARFPQLVPIYCRDGEYVVGRFQREVSERLSPSATHALTLRIDNDDAFHREMVERVRRECHGQDDELLNYLKGIQCDIDAGVAVLVRERSNPFIARIERVQPGRPVRTVMDIMHFQAADTGLLRDVEAPPMWLQTIHGGNVTNRIDHGRVLFRDDFAAAFSMRYTFRIRRWRSVRTAAIQWAWNQPVRIVRGVLRRIGSSAR
jgi:hypothetical protein